MARFSGSEPFPFPRQLVADRLSDAAFLATCVPDAVVRSASADAAVWQATARLGFATATLETTLAITGRTPGEAVSFTLTNRTTGAGLSVSSTLIFRDDAGHGSTVVDWTAEITSRSGLLKLAPWSLLQAQAQDALAEMWPNVRANLQAAGS